MQETPSLWPCQQEALDAVLSSQAPRLQVIMPCGTGKTRVGHAIATASKAQRVLVCAPSIALVSQLARSWSEMDATPRATLLVCSDAEAAEGVDLAGTPTTDPEAIGAFLGANPNGVVFSTYHSAPVVADGAEGFDLLIADEAHRIAGDEGSLGTVLLDDEVLPISRRVSMTATPRLVSGGLSMDDEDIFGPVAFEMSFREAVERGHITDYRLVICVVDPQEVSSSAYLDDKGRVTEAGRMAALLRAAHDLELGAGLVFHNRIDDSKEFAEEAPRLSEGLGLGTLQVVHLDGTSSGAERDGTLRWLAEGEGARCVSNARLLQEGVDVPSLDWVAFMARRSSVVDIAQAVGRAVRIAPGKEVGTIIVPIIADPDDLDGDVMRSEFGRVATVVKALMEHDEALRETMEAARRASVSVGGRGRLDVLEVVGIGGAVGPGLLSSLSVHVLSETTDEWWEWFARLQQFVQQFGHAHVPIARGQRGQGTLAAWVRVQRARHVRRGTLSKRRVMLLEALPGWEWDPVEALRRQQVAEVTAFCIANGHCSPDADVTLTTGQVMCTLIRYWRHRRRCGQLAATIEDALEHTSGWYWDSNASHHAHLAERVREHARLFGIESILKQGRYVSDDGFPLGKRVYNLRYRQQHGRVSEGVIAMFESIPGWQWLDDRDLV